MAMQLAEGELPYPLLRRVPQPETSFATRPVPQHARRPTGDTAAAASFPEAPEGTEDSTTEIPTRPQEVPPGRSIHEPTEQRIRGTFKHYRRHQDMFEASLRAIIVPGNRRAEFQSLLGDWGTEISPYNYERAARIAHREKGWKPQQELLGLLGQAIRAREKVQKWYLRLPADDWRRPHAAGHHNLIEILKRTYAILNHGRAYERQVGGRRTRPAVQAAPRQLPLPAAQQQLPLPFFSATPTTQPLPEGVCQTIGDANAAVSPEEAAAILPQHAGHETDASSSDSEGTNGTVDPVADSLTHELDVPLDERTIQCTARYHRHQRRFQEMLFITSVVDSDKLEFLSLFATGPHKANCKESTPMTIQNAEGFERAAEIISHNPDFQPSGKLLHQLRTTIRNRERAQRWYARLDPRDKRSGRQNRHLAFIEVLKRVYRTLSGGMVYSPVRSHRERARWQALVIVGSMLEQHSD